MKERGEKIMKLQREKIWERFQNKQNLRKTLKEPVSIREPTLLDNLSQTLANKESVEQINKNLKENREKRKIIKIKLKKFGSLKQKHESTVKKKAEPTKMCKGNNQLCGEQP